MKNNHQCIAKKVFSIENSYKKMREVYKSERREVDLAPHMTMSLSDDGMAWYVWYHSDDQKDPLVKVIPAFYLSVHTLEEILEAQPWVSI